MIFALFYFLLCTALAFVITVLGYCAWLVLLQPVLVARRAILHTRVKRGAATLPDHFNPEDWD